MGRGAAIDNQAVVTHTANHPLVVEKKETKEVVELLLEEEEEPLELVLMVDEEA